MDSAEMILAEVRELRTSVNRWQLASEKRLTKLETHMKTLLGNGQPGEISQMKRAIARLQSWRWRQIGVAAGAGGVISTLAWVLMFLFGNGGKAK